MLVMELVRENDDKVIYNYYPEGREAFGTIAIDKENGDVSVVKRSDEKELSSYCGHALRTLQKYRNIGEYKLKDTVAWC